MLRKLWAGALVLAACASQQEPPPYLNPDLRYWKPGVRIEAEETEVRRVLAQRGLRVVGRLAGPEFVALGAATRDGQHSAVRVISPRGVVVAEDAALDDLFAPAKVVLLEHFGGSFGEYVLVASARLLRGNDAGCVTLQRLLPDGRAIECVLDVGAFGSRACVSNLAPARGGKLRAKVAWPTLSAITTPQLDVEMALVEPLVGHPTPLVPVIKLVEKGKWVETERSRLSMLRLSKASFSERHAAGIARAALARLAGSDDATQADVYRAAVAGVMPASPEAEIVGATAAHIERGWHDGEARPEGAPAIVEPGDELPPGELPIEEHTTDEAIIVEPMLPSGP